MPLWRSHGRSFPAPSPVDELPTGQAAPSGAVQRHQGGRIASSAAAKELGRRGGLARARRRRELAGYGATLGLGRMLSFATDEGVAPFIAEGEAWLAEQLRAVAMDVGGGRCSPGVVSVLRTASWQRLFSAYFFDTATRAIFHWEDVEKDQEGKVVRASPRVDLLAMATRLGDSSRQNLIAAHELAAKEAESRPVAKGDVPWLK